jgi:hypothetical protein
VQALIHPSIGKHVGEYVGESFLRHQPLNASNAVFELKAFKRIFKACVDINVDLPETASLATVHSGYMM